MSGLYNIVQMWNHSSATRVWTSHTPQSAQTYMQTRSTTPDPVSYLLDQSGVENVLLRRFLHDPEAQVPRFGRAPTEAPSRLLKEHRMHKRQISHEFFCVPVTTSNYVWRRRRIIFSLMTHVSLKQCLDLQFYDRCGGGMMAVLHRVVRWAFTQHYKHTRQRLVRVTSTECDMENVIVIPTVAE